MCLQKTFAVIVVVWFWVVSLFLNSPWLTSGGGETPWWCISSLQVNRSRGVGPALYCVNYCVNTRACAVSKSRVCVTAWEMFEMLCVYIAVHMPMTYSSTTLWKHVLNQPLSWPSFRSKTLLLYFYVYQDWSVDLNRTLSRREKKKPSDGVTLTGISQTGSDQPVQPAKSSR